MTNIHILNTRGVAKLLGCSVTWIHKLVSEGKLRAYVYDDNGLLIERRPEEMKRGKGLYFRVSDVDTYQSSLQHRHFGGRKLKTGEASSPMHTCLNGLTVND